MKYKAMFRLPLDTYAYTEVQVEGTPDEVIQAYREFKGAWGRPQETSLGIIPGGGLSQKDFNAVLDRYMSDENGLDSETYAAMSESQMATIQQIKKSHARKNYKTKK